MYKVNAKLNTNGNGYWSRKKASVEMHTQTTNWTSASCVFILTQKLGMSTQTVSYTQTNSL